jgi:O-acetylserine/cysteine efflux transporter
LQSALIFSGIAQVPATMAILVVQSQVPFAVLAAWAIGQEQINHARFFGIALSLLGVALVVGLPDSIGQIESLLLIVLGTLSWGIAQGIIGATSRDPGGRLMGAMSTLAAPQLLVLSFLLESGQYRALREANLIDWAAVAILTMGGFVAAYMIWYGLLRRYRVDQIAPFILIMPIFGVLSAFLLLGERPSLLAIGGGLIILIGLAIVVRAPVHTAKDFAG